MKQGRYIKGIVIMLFIATDISKDLTQRAHVESGKKLVIVILVLPTPKPPPRFAMRGLQVSPYTVGGDLEGGVFSTTFRTLHL